MKHTPFSATRFRSGVYAGGPHRAASSGGGGAMDAAERLQFCCECFERCGVGEWEAFVEHVGTEIGGLEALLLLSDADVRAGVDEYFSTRSSSPGVLRRAAAAAALRRWAEAASRWAAAADAVNARDAREGAAQRGDEVDDARECDAGQGSATLDLAAGEDRYDPSQHVTDAADMWAGF
eukprot:Hpha_TRINITY_DN12783_c1_g1::TRINITY_DN12783_c1_g1_i1::g.114471::m.114471